MNAEEPLRREFDAVVDDMKSALGFLTRLPESILGPVTAVRPDFRRAARVFPLVGAVVGLIGGATLMVADWLGLPPAIAASLAVLATVIVTGGLHEDGLADTADGFGGGRTAAEKLEIMDDSRIGAFGGTALIFSLLLRVEALTGFAAWSPTRAGLALIVAETVSRAAMVRLWHALPAARTSGLSHETGAPDQSAMLTALAIAAAAIVLLAVPAIGLRGALLGTALVVAAAYGFTRLTAQLIGGRTGDTLGCCQQIALVAFLAGATAHG